MLRHRRSGLIGVAGTHPLRDGLMFGQHAVHALRGRGEGVKSHPHLPITQTLIEISQNRIVGGAHEGAMELAVELDELDRRFLVFSCSASRRSNSGARNSAK